MKIDLKFSHELKLAGDKIDVILMSTNGTKLHSFKYNLI
jgi:hypothetical protein